MSSILAAAAVAAAPKPEITWSVMHPTEIDPAYMRRVVEKAVEYGGVDSFEICGLEQKGINALSLFERYPRTSARIDRASVERTRSALNASCDAAHAAGKRVYFWHRENLVPQGLFEDEPGLLDGDGEFDLLGAPYGEYLRSKIGDALEACPGLDGLVLTLTESEYSVLHNSNQARYPAVKVVENLTGIFCDELSRRGKRFVLRSFGVGDDYAKIVAGAVAAAKGRGASFEIETKVTESDFVPWLPDNRYLRRSPPLSLGAECDALGEFLGQGRLPAAHVARIREYVACARREGVSRYAIRIDRGGKSIFDTANEVNLYAYMRFISDPSATEDDAIAGYGGKRFGAAAAGMAPILKSELGMVGGTCYIASNLMFHTTPRANNFRIAKAGGVFSLFREGESLADMAPIWSILSETCAPSRARIAAEKDEAVLAAERGLAAVERLSASLPPDEYARQRDAFAYAVALSRATRAFTRCALAYFGDMEARADEPARLAREIAAARAEIGSLGEAARGDAYIGGIAAYCAEFADEYRAERAMRKCFENRKDVCDFVIAGGIFDDGRVSRTMHAAYPERMASGLVRQAGNSRYPNGRLTVRLKAPETARIEVDLDPEGAGAADVCKSWKDGVWTVSVGKKGSGHPLVRFIAAVR